jgi:hypothetical protein
MTKIAFGFLAAIALLSNGDRVAPQSSDTQLVRLAVADILRMAEFPKPMNDGKRIVLDTARVGMMLGETGSIVPDQRPPLPRSSAEMRELADRAGATIAGPDDVVRCQKYLCRPFDVLTLKIGDPRFAGDSAYVVYRMFSLNGSPTFATNICYQLVITFHRDSIGWRPTLRRNTRDNQLGIEYPIRPLGRIRSAPESGAPAATAKTRADSSGQPVPTALPDSAVRCNGNTY